MAVRSFLPETDALAKVSALSGTYGVGGRKMKSSPPATNNYLCNQKANKRKAKPSIAQLLSTNTVFRKWTIELRTFKYRPALVVAISNHPHGTRADA